MKTTGKIWLGVGAVVVGTGTIGGGSFATGLSIAPAPGKFVTDTAIPRTPSDGFILAQHDHAAPAQAPAAQGGEGGEGNAIANLPPELAFAVRIALIRGHLGVGDELVKQKQWNAALPHFLHPIEELYGDIRDVVSNYKTPQFEDALKTLADAVKAKNSAAYAKALKPVNDAMAAADIGLMAKEADWPGFMAEAGIETIKTSAEEYMEALDGRRIVKPVEYQDARGFIWQGDRMIESVAPALQAKDAEALKQVRAGIVELKKIFPAPMPPRMAVEDHAALLAIIAKIELAAGKLM
jgi:hypothetical protein